MGNFKHLVVDRRDAILVVTLNRPQALNALNPEMMDELTRCFTGLTVDENVRVVILQGAGRAFCAGADIKSNAFVPHGPGRAHAQMHMQRQASAIIRAMRLCPQPIIALCHGAVCGGGFSIALASDVRIAAPDARMNAAYLKVGLGGADMGSGYFLPRLVGTSVASALLLTGDFISAERAYGVGLVTELVPQERLLDAGLAMADRMLEASPLGLKMTKDALNVLVDINGLDAAIAIEDRQQVILSETADHKVALTAVANKQKPRYSNQ